MSLVLRHRLVSVLAVGIVLAFAGPTSTASVVPSTGTWKTLKAPAPAWYTPELHARVMAAGDEGVALPAGVDVPASSLTFLGIRPGQLIIVGSVLGGFSQCTSNFVFRSGSKYAIGTAGHCGAVGQQVSMLFAPRGLVNIGQVIKSTGDAGVGNDFALISIRSTLNRFVSPSMAYWGGPKKAYSSTSVPLVVKHAGWGLVIGAGGTPRAGIGTYYSPTLYRFIGAITFGDSGSAATTGNDQALGNITHISVTDESGDTCCGTVAGTSIPKIRQIAGIWTLATCSLTIPWPGYGCPHI